MPKKNFKPAPAKKQPAPKDINRFLEHGHGHDTKKQENSNTQMKFSSKEEKLSRINFEVPPMIHARFKAACALNQTKMINELQEFVERRTVELEKSSKVAV